MASPPPPSLPPATAPSFVTRGVKAVPCAEDHPSARPYRCVCQMRAPRAPPTRDAVQHLRAVRRARSWSRAGIAAPCPSSAPTHLALRCAAAPVAQPPQLTRAPQARRRKWLASVFHYAWSAQAQPSYLGGGASCAPAHLPEVCAPRPPPPRRPPRRTPARRRPARCDARADFSRHAAPPPLRSPVHPRAGRAPDFSRAARGSGSNLASRRYTFQENQSLLS